MKYDHHELAANVARDSYWHRCRCGQLQPEGFIMTHLRASAWASLFLILSALPSSAGERLSGGELKNLFPGRFQAVVSGFINFKITARGDGSLSAVSPRGKKDRGRWSVRAGILCIEFDKWLGGRISCSPVVQETGWYQGSMIKFRRI